MKYDVFAVMSYNRNSHGCYRNACDPNVFWITYLLVPGDFVVNVCGVVKAGVGLLVAVVFGVNSGKLGNMIFKIITICFFYDT